MQTFREQRQEEDMNKKEKLKELLKDFSKEELIDFLVEDTDEETEEATDERTHEIDRKRRRGKGSRKKNRQGRKEPMGRKKGNSKGNSCRTSPIDIDSPRENKFLDFMRSTNLSAKEREELERAASSDKKDNIPARTSAPRQLNLVEAECRVCGDVYDVAPSMVHDVSRWKCNDCSTSAG